MANGDGGITIDLSEIQVNLDKLGPWLDKRVSGLMSYYAGAIGAAAKAGAPWTDRTSNARNGLTAGAGKKGQTHYIVLAHRVPYGIWLEVRWGGKYAIIEPTLQNYGPRVMGAFGRLLEKYEAGGGAA